ncbi:MAG: serine/threonine-protein kinase [Gemmatimonadales bacterium]
MRRNFLAMVRKALADRYTVERELARGGAARVFAARNRDGRLVALKILHPQLAVSVTADRFLREIGILSQLEHPRIASLLDYGEAEWLLYYVMDYVEGPTLREHLTRRERASLDDTVDIARKLLDALEYAHGRGVVHRDVKPDNVVLSAEGAVLLDFGIARAIATAGTDRLTRSGFAVGTSAYMSPEQVEGEPDIDYRSDIYSLGCVLFECLAGRPPFTAAREDIVLRMHVEQHAPDVSEFRSDAPPALAVAVARALQMRREERWQSAAEMRRALEAV